jgi:hypothetical protein
MVLTELPNCDVWHNNFAGKSAIYFPCEEVRFARKSVWAWDVSTTPIAKQ